MLVWLLLFMFCTWHAFIVEASISADSFNDYWKLDDIDGHRSPGR